MFTMHQGITEGNPIYTTHGMPGKVTEKYTHCSTVDVIKALESDGWICDKVMAARTRIIGKRGYQKHQVIMRHPQYDNAAPTERKIGDTVPRLMLSNDHSGGGAVKIQLGLFRLVCLNGLVVPDSEVKVIRFRHVGKDDLAARTLDAARQIIHEYNTRFVAKIDLMERITLTDEQLTVFAHEAATIVYPEGSNVALMNAEQLNQANRRADEANNLWTAFNRVQENIVRGGMDTTSRTKRGNYRTTRSIQSIDRLNEVNTRLMQLALDWTNKLAA